MWEESRTLFVLNLLQACGSFAAIRHNKSIISLCLAARP